MIFSQKGLMTTNRTIAAVTINRPDRAKLNTVEVCLDVELSQIA